LTELTFLPCAIEHIALIDPQGSDIMGKEHFLKPGFNYMVDDHFAISAWKGSTCLCAAGIVSLYKHRAIAWSVMSKHAGPYMRQLTRKVKEAIELHPATRIEMLVDFEFDAGHRWAEMLGFEVDAPRMEMSGYYGNDETLYVRIKR
jgi:hypothetical protein